MCLAAEVGEFNLDDFFFQVMETKNMLYLVSEYAPNGEIFGECYIP